MKTFIDYIDGNLEQLKLKEYIIDSFTWIGNRPIAPEKPTLENGIVFITKGKTMEEATYGYYDKESVLQELVKNTNTIAPFESTMAISAPARSLPSITSTVKTTIGRFIINYLLSADIVGDKLPYRNEKWDIIGHEILLGQIAMEEKLSPADYKYKYLVQGIGIGHMNEIFVPPMSEKMLETPHAIIKHRDELYAKYKDKEITIQQQAEIEKILDAEYREWIADDPGSVYLDAGGNKSYRKQQMLQVTYGGIPEFTDGKPGINIIKSPLIDGSNPEILPIAANEIIRGSVMRGKETQNGGALTKLIFRAYQDIRIYQGDCKTSNGIKLTFDEVVEPMMFIGRTIIINGKNVIITEENKDSFKNKSCVIRSPMFCAKKGCICTTCAGEYIRILGVKAIGAYEIAPASTFMSIAMAAMHLEQIKVAVLDNWEVFLT